MTLLEKSRLIPRNNWDYNCIDMLRALYALLAKRTSDTPNTRSIFKRQPIWTVSGRTSLYTILKALNLPKGSKVGVPLFCCPVVFHAIKEAGHVPCFIDSNSDECNISIDDLRKKRGGLSTIVIVHMFGNSCDMDAINSVANGIPVIEDCAHSLFSTYKNKLTGTLSTASFFSFRCGKYLSVGEASIILSNDDLFLKKIESIVSSFPKPSLLQSINHCISTYIKALFYNKPLYGIIGYPLGSILDKKINLTAKDGFELSLPAESDKQLAESRISHFLSKINNQRRHARMLLEGIKPDGFIIPSSDHEDQCNRYLFPLLFNEPSQRDVIAEHLFKCGIDTSKYLDEVTATAKKEFNYTGDCPHAEHASKTTLLVPIHYRLDENDINHIIQGINSKN